MGLEQIRPGGRIRGLDASGIAEVVSASWFGSDTLDVIYRVDGRVGQRLLFRSEENSIEVIAGGRAFGFDGDGQLLRLASEAMRIRLAHLFDPYMAVHASRIEALPHQITAVYAEMLPRQPLRFLLADDPGAGKTIMAGFSPQRNAHTKGALGGGGCFGPPPPWGRGGRKYFVKFKKK